MVIRSFSTLLFCLLVLPMVSFRQVDQECCAWEWSEGSRRSMLTLVDSYMVFTSFDVDNRKFHYTWGGPYRIEGNKLVVERQFHTRDKELVGKAGEWEMRITGDKLECSLEDAGQVWSRVDRGDAPLSGVWRISGRKQGEKMGEIGLNARRTLKILSGTRFQWAAINIETGEFFGTGGGTYSFANGKYAEKIEFFSRDSSRVGAVLTFDGKVENGDWHHSGLSSKGEPIYEIWSRLNSK